MKAYWDNLFFDMEESGFSKEMFAAQAGEDIRKDLLRIEDAIRALEPKEALRIIEEMKKDY